MDLERIKRKIRGVLAKADEGSGATEAEAASALAFARRLMLRHHLTDEDVRRDERTPDEAAADCEYDTASAWSEGASLSVWETVLCNAIAGLVGSVGSYHAGRGVARTPRGTADLRNGKSRTAVEIRWYGPAEDARDAAELFGEWSVAIAALARLKYGGALRGPGRSYAFGFAQGLYEQVQGLRAKECQLQPGEGEREHALVVQSNAIQAAKRERADEWLRKEQGVRLTSRSGAYSGVDGEVREEGRRDGRRADFDRTVTRKLGC